MTTSFSLAECSPWQQGAVPCRSYPAFLGGEEKPTEVVFSRDALSGRQQPSPRYADLLLTSKSGILLASTFSSCLETAKEDGLSSSH